MPALLRALAVLGAVLALACGEGSETAAAPGPPPPPDPSPPPAATPPTPPAKPVLADGEAIFRVRCVTCHGELGDGKGPLGAALEPRPRDFGSPAWQDSVSDAHIESVIAGGGAGVGLSAAMPPHPDLAPGELAAVRAHVRSLRR